MITEEEEAVSEAVEDESVVDNDDEVEIVETVETTDSDSEVVDGSGVDVEETVVEADGVPDEVVGYCQSFL